MKGYKKHHIIGRQYYKFFASADEKIFCRRIKVRNGKIYNTRYDEVEHRNNFFSLSPPGKHPLINKANYDKLYIEIDLFQKYEDQYSPLVLKLIDSTSSFSFVDKEELIKSIHLFKYRSIKVREHYVGKMTLNEKSYYKSLIATEKSMIDAFKGYEEYIQNYAHYLRSFALPDKKDIQNEMIINLVENTLTDHSHYLNMLIKGKWRLLEINNGTEFITSDSPGFSYLNGLYHDFYYKDKGFDFYFPLSKKWCLVIETGLQDESISKEYCSLDLQLAINLFHALLSYMTIYSGNEAVLKDNVIKYFFIKSSKLPFTTYCEPGLRKQILLSIK